MSLLLRYTPGDRAVEFLLVVTIVVAVASSAAWLIARPLAWNAALRQHVLYCGMICCLASPALVWFCGVTGVTLVSIPLFPGERGRGTPEAMPAEPDSVGRPSRTLHEPPPTVLALTRPPTNISIEPKADVAGAPMTDPRSAISIPASPDVPRAGQPAETCVSLREIATLATFVWAGGGLLLLVRLARDICRVMELRRTSHPLQNESHRSLLEKIATSRLGTRQVPLLLVSSRTMVPLAVGFGRPAVIFPERLLGAVSVDELKDVFIHELAHITQGDHWIVLLQELAGALYWPIVPVHLLNRALQRAREEICDNAVLADRDALSYGETLLHVAELLMGARPMAVTVGMIGGRGELERRIAGLIDPRRSLTIRIGRRKACIVMGLFIAGGAIASATRFATSTSATETTLESISVGEKPGRESTTPSPSHAELPPVRQRADAPPKIDLERMVVLHGKIVGPGDRPVAGARLYLSADHWRDPLELGTSDARGAYRLSAAEKSFRHYTDDTHTKTVRASLIVVADGLAPEWVDLPAVDLRDGWQMAKSEYAHDFRLEADFPIAGRLVDSRGKPVSGAVVSVNRITSLAEPHWAPILAAIKAGNPDRLDREQSHPNYWDRTHYSRAWSMMPEATTDAEGHFRLAGIGRDRAAKLNVEGPGVRSTVVTSLTRDGVDGFTQALRAKYPRTPQSGNSSGEVGAMLFGPSPTIEIESEWTVAGVVRDARTGRPVSNVRMWAGANGLTDRHGRYRMPRGNDDRAVQVHAYPNQERYLSAIRRFERREDDGEIIANFELSPGVAVSGRVVESGTDRAIVSGPRSTCHAPWPGPLIAGRIYYFPLSTNVSLRGTSEGAHFEDVPARAVNHSTSAVIDGNGQFRISVPPGPGVLFVMSAPGFPEFADFGISKESEGLHRLFPYLNLATRSQDDGAPAGDARSLPGFNGPIPLENYHAYRVINPSADATALEVTLTVPRAATRLVRFVGPDGGALRGVRVRGLNARGMTVVLDGTEAEVIALEPGRPRPLFAISNDGKYTGRMFVRTEDQPPKSMQLEPAGTIRGRIVDANGKSLKTLLSPTRGPVRFDAFDVGFIPQVRTDDDGRFRVGALFPGQHYSAEIRGGAWHTEVLGKAFEDVVLRNGEERDLGEIRIPPSVAIK